MGWGSGNLGGGSGGGLNFKVVGNPQPSNPKENTIWVNAEKIGAWYFSATQPEGMQEWDVWFRVGTSSSGEFNALKKGGIQVYPLSAKQMVSGALKYVTAKSWQNGAWVEWIFYLYSPGNQHGNITGGWVSEAIKENLSVVVARAPTMATDDNGYLRIGYDSSGTYGGISRMKKKFLLKDTKQLSFSYDAYCSAGESTWLTICVWSKMGTYYQDNLVCEQEVIIGQDENINVDVSELTDSYYIGIRVYTDSGITIKEIAMR